MKNKRKAGIIVSLISVILLCSCGKSPTIADNMDGNSSKQEQKTTEVSAYWQDSHTPLSNRYDGVTMKGDMIYGYCNTEEGTLVMTQNARTGELIGVQEIPKAQKVTNITLDAQGNLFLLENSNFWKLESDGTYTFYDGETIKEQDDAWMPELKGVYADQHGFFYFQYQIVLPSKVFYPEEEDDVYTMVDRIYVKDEQLHTRYYVQIPDSNGSKLLQFSVNSDGKPMALIKRTDGIYIEEVNEEMHDFVVKKQLEETDFNEIDRIFFTENGFLFCIKDALYLYDYENDTQEKLFNLSSIGVMAETMLFLEMKDGKIQIIDSPVDSSSEYVVADKSAQAKTVLTLGVMQSSGDLQRIVAGYNRTSKEGKIEIVEYYTGGDFDRSLENLRLDIVRGKAPDIMEISVINADNFINKGVFADLYNFMENDAELNKTMIMESVRNAYESDGHLYSIGAAFQLYTIWGAEKIIQGKQGVKMNEFLQILQNKGKNANAVYGFSADEPVLTTLCTFGMDEFIDWENGKSDFNNDYMKALMDFAANYTGAYRGGLIEGIKAGEILLSVGIISSVGDYQLEKELYGGTLSFVGYPTTKGTGNAISLCGGELAVNGKCEHLNLAWDFVKYFVQNGYAGYGFPSLKKNFETAMAESMKDDERVFVDGVYKVPKKTYSDGENYVEVFAAGQEDVEAVRRLIESADTRYKYNTEVQKIIDEESGSYFSGQKNFEDVAGIIESRVDIYLKEQMD